MFFDRTTCIVCAQVDGLLARGPGPSRCWLAAVGVAGAWRLGAWGLLRSYLAILHDQGSAGEWLHASKQIKMWLLQCVKAAQTNLWCRSANAHYHFGSRSCTVHLHNCHASNVKAHSHTHMHSYPQWPTPAHLLQPHTM